MGTPAKKRKLNSDAKASPVASRNLDFFFGKQKEKVAALPPKSSENQKEDSEKAQLTDEELARKLQAEWNEEGEAMNGMNGASSERAKQDPMGALSSEELRDGNFIYKQAEDGQEPNTEVKLGDEAPKSNPVEFKETNTLTLRSNGSAEEIISSNIPFDESPLTFDPAKYVTELQGHWAKEGGDASYALLTSCFVLVNSTQSRIKIVDTLVNLLRVLIEGDPTSLLPTVGTAKIFYTVFSKLLVVWFSRQT